MWHRYDAKTAQVVVGDKSAEYVQDGAQLDACFLHKRHKVSPHLSR